MTAGIPSRMNLDSKPSSGKINLLNSQPLPSIQICFTRQETDSSCDETAECTDHQLMYKKTLS